MADELFSTQREEIYTRVRVALDQLNGGEGAALTLMTGLSAEEIDDLGGLPRD